MIYYINTYLYIGMARILCDNNDGTVSAVQTNAFSVPSET